MHINEIQHFNTINMYILASNIMHYEIKQTCSC